MTNNKQPKQYAFKLNEGTEFKVICADGSDFMLLMDLLDKHVDSKDQVCQSCGDNGYLEVTHDDNCEYIEACETCDYFGIMEFDGEPTLDEKAIQKAKKDGVKCSKNGKVLS